MKHPKKYLKNKPSLASALLGSCSCRAVVFIFIMVLLIVIKPERLESAPDVGTSRGHSEALLNSD